ncbi:LysR family transcriptional regulator [Undibacterium curvum]|uniref:LysR family transcriptional regulator n=1 Tax=Undibacterium curvum TaxID=2762294 RepID=UPI003D10CB0F
MLPLDPSDINLIITLSREYSLTATAIRLGITPSAASQRLENIEEKVGHRIANRKGRVSLNKVGQELLRLCLKLQEQFDSFSKNIEQLMEPKLRVIADQSLLIHDLPQVVQMMMRETPTLQVQLSTGSFSEITRAVIEDEADAGIIAGSPHIIGLQLRAFRTERICLLVRNTHPIARSNSISFSEALKYPLILSANLEHIGQIIENFSIASGVKLNAPLIVPNFEVQAHYVSTTEIGIAPTLESVANRFKKHQSVTAISITDAWAENVLSFVLREKGSLSNEVNSLIKHVTNLYRSD